MNRAYMWIMGAIVFCVAFFVAFADAAEKQTESAVAGKLKIEMTDEGEVASDALWLTRYKFGPGLNANRNSIQVYKGYIFVSWYTTAH